MRLWKGLVFFSYLGWNSICCFYYFLVKVVGRILNCKSDKVLRVLLCEFFFLNCESEVKVGSDKLVLVYFFNFILG